MFGFKSTTFMFDFRFSICFSIPPFLESRFLKILFDLYWLLVLPFMLLLGVPVDIYFVMVYLKN